MVDKPKPANPELKFSKEPGIDTGKNITDPHTGKLQRVYKDSVTGTEYTVSGMEVDPVTGKQYDSEILERNRKEEARKKEMEEKQVKERERIEKEKIENERKEKLRMADEVTKFDLLKRDIDQRDKEFGAKVQGVEKVTGELDNKVKGVEKVTGELDNKVKGLDDRVCKGEECYTKIEKNQADMFKILEERLKSLSEPRFVCAKCSAASIRKGDKVCSECGATVNVIWN